MMPDNVLSSSAVAASFIAPKRLNYLVDYEFGALALQDASAGLSATLWTAYYEDGQIKLSHDDEVATVLTVANVTHLSFAIDLSMRPIVAYIVGENCYLWWYDTSVAAQITTDLGTGITYPQLSLDERRSVESANSDVIFAYIKNEKLLMRLQRDRYQTEYHLDESKKRLMQIGMMQNNRFGFAYYHW